MGRNRPRARGIESMPQPETNQNKRDAPCPSVRSLESRHGYREDTILQTKEKKEKGKSQETNVKHPHSRSIKKVPPSHASRFRMRSGRFANPFASHKEQPDQTCLAKHVPFRGPTYRPCTSLQMADHFVPAAVPWQHARL